MEYLYFSFLSLTLGALLTALIRNKIGSGVLAVLFTSISAVLLIDLALDVLFNNKIFEEEVFSLLPLLNASIFIRVDALSALFLLIVAIVSFCVCLFSVKYISSYSQSSLSFYPPILSLFASSVGLVCIKDLLFFILFWEMMTLTSWILVVFEREKKQALKAGLQYFIATHVATAFLILAAVIIYSYSNSFEFSEVYKSLGNILVNNSLLGNFLIFCFFIAFVTKAGVLPFGFWLPNAYPQPPSSASSFFGGVMSKLAVYAILRFFLSVIPLSSTTEAWGFVIAFFGVISIFIGTIAALTQDEAKRLMSFHAIGQVGYMLLGIGVGIYFIHISPFLSVIALTGGIFHAFNNSIYKSLLFLNAGAIFYKTSTTDLNRVSGLIKVMPLTALAAMVGALSIAGVPPFNGFVSKLLIFESSIWSARVNEALFLVKGAFIIFGIISIFISAITLASFLKFINSAFMGKFKEEDIKGGRLSWSMTLPQIILATICVVTGLFPSVPIKFMYDAILVSSKINLPDFNQVFSADIAGIGINYCQSCLSSGAWYPLFIISSTIMLSLIIFSFERYAGAKIREVKTWYGGKEHTPEEVIYTGHSFYQPFKEIVSFKVGGIYFKGFYPSEFPPLKFAFPKWITKIIQPDDWFYYPLANLISKFFDRMSNFYERLNRYYIFWFVLGSLLVGILVFYFYGGKL